MRPAVLTIDEVAERATSSAGCASDAVVRMTSEQAAALRAPFPHTAIGKLPKAGAQLDYVGHAAVTDRLLAVDPEWSWEPFALTDTGDPRIILADKEAWMWIRLTVCGVTRPGVGTARRDAFDLPKQLVSDAIRNAAMRFGVALDLWSKEELGGSADLVERTPSRGSSSDKSRERLTNDDPPAGGGTSEPSPELALLRKQVAERCRTHPSGVLAERRKAAGLPLVKESDPVQLAGWSVLLDGLDAERPM